MRYDPQKPSSILCTTRKTDRLVPVGRLQKPWRPLLEAGQTAALKSLDLLSSDERHVAEVHLAMLATNPIQSTISTDEQRLATYRT